MGERVCVGVLCMCHRTFALCEKGTSLTRQVSRGKSHEASLTKQFSRSKSHEASLTKQVSLAMCAYHSVTRPIVRMHPLPVFCPPPPFFFQSCRAGGQRTCPTGAPFCCARVTLWRCGVSASSSTSTLCLWRPPQSSRGPGSLSCINGRSRRSSGSPLARDPNGMITLHRGSSRHGGGSSSSPLGVRRWVGSGDTFI